MKMLTILGILFIGFNSHALDCNQLAASLSAKANDHHIGWYSGQMTNMNLSELNLLVQLYHDACGPIPQKLALQLADTIVTRGISPK